MLRFYQEEKEVKWIALPDFIIHNILLLILKAPITTAADNILKYFFLIFQRKQVLIFHVNRLPSRRFT